MEQNLWDFLSDEIYQKKSKVFLQCLFIYYKNFLAKFFIIILSDNRSTKIKDG
jgi:hypothetical protein